MVEQIWQTVLSEFSDIPDVANLTLITLRLVLAALLGAILGYNREVRGNSAGLRTHMLVSLGAALFVLIPYEAGGSIADISRVLSGLVSGVGFLGAGAIIKLLDQEETKGLTSAASIWVTAAIGVAAGMGRECTALLGTLLAMGILTIVAKVKSSISNSSP